MKLILGVITLIALTAGSALPQDGEEKKTRIGIGVQLNPPVGLFDDEIFLPIGYSLIQLTVLTESIRIEPTFGIIRFHDEHSGEFPFESTISQLRLGVGVYWTTRKRNTFFYSGGHLGIIRNSRSSKSLADSNEDKSTDLAIGPVVGVEYLFDNHLSVGGEAQLKYVSIGQEEEETDRSESIISTDTAITLRWYF